MTVQQRSELISAAKAVCRDLRLRSGFTAGSVGAAIRARSGHIYTGICMDLGSGLGFCAEVAAIAEMVKNGETEAAGMVAVCGDGILPPCGRCRETLAQLDEKNLDCAVIITGDKEMSLRELLPEHWLEAKKTEKK